MQALIAQLKSSAAEDWFNNLCETMPDTNVCEFSFQECADYFKVDGDDLQEFLCKFDPIPRYCDGLPDKSLQQLMMTEAGAQDMLNRICTMQPENELCKHTLDEDKVLFKTGMNQMFPDAHIFKSVNSEESVEDIAHDLYNRVCAFRPDIELCQHTFEEVEQFLHDKICAKMP